jgi:hypothetical protein
VINQRPDGDKGMSSANRFLRQRGSFMSSGKELLYRKVTCLK